MIVSRRMQGRRQWAAIAFVVVSSVVLWMMLVPTRMEQLSSLIQMRGAPVLMARMVTIEPWDLNSQSLLKSKQLTITAPRDWSGPAAARPGAVLVYCDSTTLVSYWKMVRDGSIIAENQATVALGTSVSVVCYTVAEDGRTCIETRGRVSFVQFNLR